MEKPTREELSQVYYLNKEIKNLKDIIDAEYSGGSIKSPVITGMPKGGSVTGSPVESLAVRQEKSQRKLEALIEKRNQEQEKLLEYVGTVKDSRLRMIIMLRCYCLLSWKEVADRIGGPNNAENLRQIFNREYKEC